MPSKRNNTGSIAAQASVAMDLRPFSRISALGARTDLRRFIIELLAQHQPGSQVIAIAGATDSFVDRTELNELSRAEDLGAALALRRPGVHTLLLLCAPDGPATGGADGLSSDAKLTIQTLFLGFCPEVDAIISLDGPSGRSLFVRSVSTPPLHHSASTTGSPLLLDATRSLATVTTEPVGIAILGPAAMTGTEIPLERHPKLTELVVYLALHPEGTTSRNWTTALWPERRVPAQTVANRLSEARRILGFAPDGRPRLRRNGERYILVDCRTDWQTFQELARSASPKDWKRALSLVRGRPFDELAQGQWVLFEGYAAEIERTITTVAIELGTFALDHREAELGTWAAQQALRACPFDERLHRLLMRAADALGNRAGVEETLRQLALILEIEGDPLHGVHPKTAKLYAELTDAT